MDYDEDEFENSIRIQWTREQKKDLKIGFTFLGIVILFIIGITIWFFFPK